MLRSWRRAALVHPEVGPANAKTDRRPSVRQPLRRPNQAYFSEGIAEELRSALTRIGLQVIGRASSDAVKELDTKVIASKLGVANILTGSVRRSRQMVRISAQLVDGGDGVPALGADLRSGAGR